MSDPQAMTPERLAAIRARIEAAIDGREIRSVGTLVNVCTRDVPNLADALEAAWEEVAYLKDFIYWIANHPWNCQFWENNDPVVQANCFRAVMECSLGVLNGRNLDIPKHFRSEDRAATETAEAGE